MSARSRRETVPTGTPRNGPLAVLHVASEIHPIIKTGGLADVVGALPAVQASLGDDVRLLVPGYPVVMEALEEAVQVASLGPIFGAARVRLLRGRLRALRPMAYVIDAPLLYRRAGGPYHDAQGRDWPDNLQRFALLGWVGAQIAVGGIDEPWQPDLVHAHDWHAGMACAYLHAHAASLPSVFTVHNLAYQGLFPHEDAGLLGLSSRFLSSAGLEFHGQLSFMKAGLKFARHLTTVSPGYAREIERPEFGHGLDGVIRARAGELTGIMNGIDVDEWNPQTDPAIAQPYQIEDLSGKALCKAAIQEEAGLLVQEEAPLLLVLSRLTHQKGIDLLLAALPAWLALGGQLVVQGAGEPVLEAACRDAATASAGWVAVFIGYDEARAHRLMAGADLIAVPSRFEPCGLTQMYGLRYGTLPVVRRVGGLADTVFESPQGALPPANGFVFDDESPQALVQALTRAFAAWQDPFTRTALQRQGMRADLSWEGPARSYRALYTRLCSG